MQNSSWRRYRGPCAAIVRNFSAREPDLIIGPRCGTACALGCAPRRTHGSHTRPSRCSEPESRPPRARRAVSSSRGAETLEKPPERRLSAGLHQAVVVNSRIMVPPNVALTISRAAPTAMKPTNARTHDPTKTSERIPTRSRRSQSGSPSRWRQPSSGRKRLVSGRQGPRSARLWAAGRSRR